MQGLRRWLASAAVLLFWGGLLLGPSLYLDARGRRAPGAVVDKRESIRVAARQAGAWSRDTILVVCYQRPTAARRRRPASRWPRRTTTGSRSARPSP